VLEAANGRDAFQLASSADVDLLITDLVMPEQEGLETLGRLRKLRADLAIVAISGAFGGSLLSAARLLGAQATLPKPISADALISTVHDVLAGRSNGNAPV
jgi:DNA-binding NarL/FixJ family response regulator